MRNKYFALFGLILNFVGAIILLFPLLDISKNINDDFIVNMNRETGEYTQVKHVTDRKFALWGLLFLFPSFLIQIAEIKKGSKISSIHGTTS